jgi:hypothetical protein
MSLDQEIDKLKGHTLILSQEFRDLIETFSMLLPMNENQDLICRVSKTKRARGFEVLRWNLVQQCIIGVNKLVYDNKPQNPTAGNLIEAILSAPQGMRDKLKAVFSVPIKSAPLIYLSEEEEKEQAAVWEEIEKIEIRELQQIFDAYLPKLEQEWEWFNERKQIFKDLRDKNLAHVDVTAVGLEYRLAAPEGPTWKEVKEAVERLVHVTESLLTILHRKDESFGQLQAIAAEVASDFWEIF